MAIPARGLPSPRFRPTGTFITSLRLRHASRVSGQRMHINLYFSYSSFSFPRARRIPSPIISLRNRRRNEPVMGARADSPRGNIRGNSRLAVILSAGYKQRGMNKVERMKTPHYANSLMTVITLAAIIRQ